MFSITLHLYDFILVGLFSTRIIDILNKEIRRNVYRSRIPLYRIASEPRTSWKPDRGISSRSHSSRSSTPRPTPPSSAPPPLLRSAENSPIKYVSRNPFACY